MKLRSTFHPPMIASVLLAMLGRADAQDSADKKTIKRILQGIELVPSLRGQDEGSVKFKSLPKFSAKRLAEYGVDKKDTVELERERWRASKEQYARGYPLRAAIFEAAMEMESLTALKTPMTLQAAVLPKELFHNGRVKDPHWEYCPGAGLVGVTAWLGLHMNSRGSRANALLLAAMLRNQEPSAEAILKLQQVLQHMQEAAAERDKEKSKRWRADFDFALGQVGSNLVFLFEYNHALGQIRGDNLPDLRPGEVGWQIAFQQKVTVMEQKPKNYAKERRKLLQQMQADYAETPWAYFAERESRCELGMVWVAKK